MTDEEISVLIERIIDGRHFFTYKHQRYYTQSASLDVKIKSNFIYQEIVEKYLFDDAFVHPESLDFLLKFHRIIPSDYEQKIKSLEKSIENIKIALYKNYKNKKLRQSSTISLKKEQDELSQLTYKKHSWDFLLLHNFANKAKIEFLFCHNIHDYATNKLVFEYDNLDYQKLYSMIDILQTDSLKDISTYKYIAKSGVWRNYWVCSKENIFNDKVSNWTDEQRTLVSISKMFDSIYENPECPDEEILNDFDALDGWMILQRRKNSSDKKEKSVNELLGSKGKNSSEVFLMAQSTQEMDEIVDMNSDESLHKYKTRLKMLSTSNTPLKDTDFPDVRAEINRKLKGP